MTNRRADYVALEHEYVTTDLSLRDLAKRHDLGWSALSVQSRKRDWVNKRLSYKDSLARRTWEKVADRTAHETSEIRAETLIVMRATLHRYAELLRNKEIIVSTKDAVAAANLILLMIGEPTERSEAKVIEFSTGGLDADFLRGLVEASRLRLEQGEAPEPAGLRIAEPLAE